MGTSTGRTARSAAYFQLLGIVAALVAILWGAIYLDLRRAHDEAFAKSRSDLSNLAVAVAKDIESSVKEIDVMLLDLRGRWQDDPARFPVAIRNRQAYLEKGLTLQVAVIGADGMLVFTNLEQPANPVDLGDREHFRIHRARSTDELFISKPVLGRVSNRWSIQFTRPVYDKAENFAGVIVLSVSPEYFYQFVRKSTLPEHGIFNLIRNSGEVLSRYPHPELGLGKSVRQMPFVDEFAPEAGFYQEKSQLDGMERLYAWRKVERYRLAVSIGHSIDGILAPYHAQQTRIVFAGGGISALLLMVAVLNLRGIAHRQKVAAEIAANEERWRLALEAAGDGVWDWDVPASRVVFSRGWKSMLGYAPEDIGNGLDEWKSRVHPDDLDRVMQDVTAHLEGKTETYTNEHRVRCKDGSWKWILDRGMVILRDKKGAPLRMVGTHTDISVRKNMEEVLKNQATTDSLTGLDNRRFFFEKLEKEMSRVKRYPGVQASLLMVDLDHFKKINDTYGHSTGDAVLKHFAGLLRSSARRTDFIGRIGGEEFAILLTETGLEQAKRYAQMLCETVRQSPLEIEGHTIRTTVSIGLTRLKARDEDADVALERADTALYEAKNTGRDRAVARV